MLCTNRHTMKRRIRRIISLCILITITIFCTLLLLLGINFFKYSTGFLTDYFSSNTAQNLGSDYFLEQMGISSLNELEPDSVKFREWVVNMKKSSSISTVRLVKPVLSDMHGHMQKEQVNEPDASKPKLPSMPGLFSELNSGDLFKVKITINSKVVYDDTDMHNSNTIGVMDKFANERFEGSPLLKLINYFGNQSTTNVTDSNGNIIASVSACTSQGYILTLGMVFVTGVLFAGILAIIAGLLISKILTIPVVVPLIKLNEKIREIASDTGEAAMTKHVEIRKPLREIELLADSTNSIMEKLKEYNELLMAQNQELEAQNEELANSKKQIEEAQNLLIQTENMASIGQLTAAITHEINTPLGAISSNAQMSSILLKTILELKQTVENNELLESLTQLQEANDVSVMACSRVNQIIRSLKNFSKVDQAEFQEADINEGMKSVLVLTSNLWKRKIAIQEEYGDIPRIKCFPGMLNQVFMNLIVNSVQSIEDKGDIYIKTWNDEKFLYVSVKDNGCGISEENLSKIFESGFTTKGQSLGMGLGLSISRSIMNKHNGEITVSSRAGEGSEFVVKLPLTQERT
jgi:signal transduction histidine kinase